MNCRKFRRSPHRARLRRHQPDTFDSDQCIICNQHVEDDFHFVVGCSYKWQIWSTAVKELGWSSHAISKKNIWKNMLLQDKTTLRLVNNAIWDRPVRHHMGGSMADALAMYFWTNALEFGEMPIILSPNENQMESVACSLAGPAIKPSICLKMQMSSLVVYC
jgi:hypothetical protein